MEPKRLDDMTMEELASLDFEAEKAHDVGSAPLQEVKARLTTRALKTNIRGGMIGWPPSARSH